MKKVNFAGKVLLVVLVGVFWVALLSGCALTVAENKGKVKEEVKEVKVGKGKAKIVEINGQKYLVFDNGQKIEVRGSIKREVLENLEKKMLNGKIKGVKYFNPKKDMKRAESYFILLNGITPYPYGNAINQVSSELSDFGKALVRAINAAILTSLFPAKIIAPKMISPEVIEGKNWYVIPGVVKNPNTGERSFPVLQIFNKKRLKQLLYDAAEWPDVMKMAEANEETVEKFRNSLKDGLIFEALSIEKCYPFAVTFGVFSDYPYFFYDPKKHILTEKRRKVNIGAFLPLYTIKQRKKFGEEGLKTFKEEDFLFKLIKEGKISKEDPWYDAIKKGYVKIVEVDDPNVKGETVLLVITPTNVYAYMDDGESQGIFMLQTDFLEPLYPLEDQHIFCGIDYNTKNIGVVVFNKKSDVMYVSAFGQDPDGDKCRYDYYAMVKR